MREVVEDVRRIAQSSEQNERWSPTAPIEHFDPHIRRDGDERNLVPRRVRARVNRRHVVGGAKKHNDCDQTDKRTRRIERSQTAALHSNTHEPRGGANGRSCFLVIATCSARSWVPPRATTHGSSSSSF